MSVANALRATLAVAPLFIAVWSPAILAESPDPEASPNERSVLQSEVSGSISKLEDEMLLVCDGSTFTVAPTSQSNASVTDNQGYMVSGTATATAPINLEFQVRLRIVGSDAEMSMPPIAAPTINSGNGWWYKVKDLKISENEISGKIKMNWFISSSFRIDRRTGSISSEGGFSGICWKEDLQKRAF